MNMGASIIGIGSGGGGGVLLVYDQGAAREYQNKLFP